MNDYQKLIEILEKDNLTSEERNYLNNLRNEDHDAQNIFAVYEILKSSGRKKTEVSNEILADYVLYINGLEPENKNVISLTPEIEKQIRTSGYLKNEFEKLNAEYSDIDNFITRTFTQKENNNTVQPNFYKRFRIPVYSLSALVLIYVVLFAAFNIFSPDYKKHILLYDNSDKSFSRGRISESFQQSLNYINNNDYKTAAEFLLKDIAENSQSKTVFYSHYILGLIYLRNSESNILGIVKTYDDDYLKKGITQLQQAVEKNSNVQFKNIKLNSYFFIANAYIALDDIEKAKTYLKLVQSEKGSYMKDAEILLNSFAEER